MGSVMEMPGGSCPDSVRIKNGYLVPSLYRPFIWIYFTENDREIEIRVSRKTLDFWIVPVGDLPWSTVNLIREEIRRQLTVEKAA